MSITLEGYNLDPNGEALVINNEGAYLVDRNGNTLWLPAGWAITDIKMKVSRAFRPKTPGDTLCDPDICVGESIKTLDHPLAGSPTICRLVAEDVDSNQTTIVEAPKADLNLGPECVLIADATPHLHVAGTGGSNFAAAQNLLIPVKRRLRIQAPGGDFGPVNGPIKYDSMMAMNVYDPYGPKVGPLVCVQIKMSPIPPELLNEIQCEKKSGFPFSDQFPADGCQYPDYLRGIWEGVVATTFAGNTTLRLVVYKNDLIVRWPDVGVDVTGHWNPRRKDGRFIFNYYDEVVVDDPNTVHSSGLLYEIKIDMSGKCMLVKSVNPNTGLPNGTVCGSIVKC